MTSYRIVKLPHIILATLMFLITLRTAVAQSGSTTHIEVVVRPRHFSSDTPEEQALTKHNFLLQQAGKPIPIEIVRGDRNRYPTHLLLITHTPVSLCAAVDPYGLQKLAARGWTISIATGNSVKERTSAEQADGKPSCAIETRSIESSLHLLAAQAGRRIVVFDDASAASLLSAAAYAIPEVYSIDGGLTSVSFTPLQEVPQSSPSISDPQLGPYNVPCHEIGKIENPNDLCHQGTSITSKRAGYSHGVTHEKSLAAALREIQNSGDRYYDLSFHNPSSTESTPIKLSVHGRDGIKLAITLYDTTPLPDNGSGLRSPDATPFVVAQR